MRKIYKSYKYQVSRVYYIFIDICIRMSFKWGPVDDAYSNSRINDNCTLSVTVHLQGKGDVTGKDKEWVGTKAQNRRLEGFSIRRLSPTDSFQIMYKAHLQGYGDVSEEKEGHFIGTKGQTRRLQGFSIKLADQKGPVYDVYYQAHIQGIGDTAIHKNGEFCGTTGQTKRVEAIKIWIQPVK